MIDAPRLLQVCPNDHPPFADICRFYESAARSLGWLPVTVMLGARAVEPEPGFHYLNGPVKSLERVLPVLLGDHLPVLTLCHRYRAYRAVLDHADGRAPPPVLVVAHEFGLLQRARRRWRWRLDRWLGRPAVTFAGVSEAVALELRHAAGEALVFPNGIDLARADEARLAPAGARRVLGLPERAFVVGMVGRLHPKKRPALAVEGFARAAPAMPGARLVVVGDGTLRGELEARAGGAPVTFAGFLADAASVMPAFNLLLLPSGDREAFGMVALEAMAARVPVLCGPAPGPRSVVGDTGLSFQPDDADGVAAALVSAYRDFGSGALAELGSRARARVDAEFSIAAAAARLSTLAAGHAIPAEGEAPAQS